jgi:hypothetical protein
MPQNNGIPGESSISSVRQELERLCCEHVAIAQRLNYVEASIAQMQSDIAVLDDRRSGRLAAADAERTDHSDGRHIAQLEIARQYQNFVEQDLFSLARTEITFSRSRAPRREWIPRCIGSMCAELFRVGDAPTLHAKGERRQHVLAAAEAIRNLADQSGLNCSWDFYFTHGRLVDERWQQPWGGCDVKDPVKFLVAPAYVVDNYIYQRQQVFTAPRKKIDLCACSRGSGCTSGDRRQPFFVGL